MNLAAYASETYKWDDKSTQKNQGIKALNMWRRREKYYVRHNFVLGRIQFLRSISACLIVHVVENGGMLRKRGTGNKHGRMKN